MLILASFVPEFFSGVVQKINEGAPIGMFSFFALLKLAILGMGMYIFDLYNKKVTKCFEPLF
jgi:hypothetical protein